MLRIFAPLTEALVGIERDHLDYSDYCFRSSSIRKIGFLESRGQVL